MSRHVNAISNRLSLRSPQRESLQRLHRTCELVPFKQKPDLATALEIIRSEYPTVTDFERNFPSLCFALATGVGKTRLMGAFITYLHLAHGINNFFVLAPNLTIYNKLITDFTPNTPKYVFKGIPEFATDQPELITGDNYQNRARTLYDELIKCKINIFNISKINSKDTKVKRLSEYIGQSYFDYLTELDDLVILMDESHRYRASAGVEAINELKPILGLELTATPRVEKKGKAKDDRFENIIYDYRLGSAIADGFVKDPAVITRKDFNPTGMSKEDIERLKLEDGVRLHESIKTELVTYAREANKALVKPFVLIIARDITHASELKQLIESEQFFKGRYADRVIQVDSSTKKKEEKTVERLLQVESAKEPTEIVIHVNMLKEGWDVTNLYTIIPLRAANAKILIEQSIGRGLRLPYGKRTGVPIVDRLSIIAHDKFQALIDESNQDDSAVRLQGITLDPEDLEDKISIPITPNIDRFLGYQQTTDSNDSPESRSGSEPQSIFTDPEEQKVAQIAHQVIQELERSPSLVPTSTALQSTEIQQLVREKVEARYAPEQMELPDMPQKLDIGNIVEVTTNIVINQTIDIPKILVVPTGPVETGFNPFELKLDGLNYLPITEELWSQSLATGKVETIKMGAGGINESRLEDYIIRKLIDFDDIDYNSHADLLYSLAQQIIEHLESYLSEEEIPKVLAYYELEIAKFIHAQMQPHFWEKAGGYEVKVHSGFTAALRRSGATTGKSQKTVLDYRLSPPDKSNMAKYIFEGFSKCLYDRQKFDSEAERLLAVILERDALKWFRPNKEDFQLFYRATTGQSRYQPDFVAETEDCIYMLEPKRENQMKDEDVLAKQEAAVQWCQQASEHAQENNGKPWIYALIPHSAIAQNMTIKGLTNRFST